jgi:hypothetical protein
MVIAQTASTRRIHGRSPDGGGGPGIHDVDGAPVSQRGTARRGRIECGAVQRGRQHLAHFGQEGHLLTRRLRAASRPERTRPAAEARDPIGESLRASTGDSGGMIIISHGWSGVAPNPRRPGSPALPQPPYQVPSPTTTRITASSDAPNCRRSGEPHDENRCEHGDGIPSKRRRAVSGRFHDHRRWSAGTPRRVGRDGTRPRRATAAPRTITKTAGAR